MNLIRGTFNSINASEVDSNSKNDKNCKIEKFPTNNKNWRVAAKMKVVFSLLSLGMSW